MSLPSPNIQSAKSEISAENHAKSKNPESEELTHNQGNTYIRMNLCDPDQRCL